MKLPDDKLVEILNGAGFEVTPGGDQLWVRCLACAKTATGWAIGRGHGTQAICDLLLDHRVNGHPEMGGLKTFTYRNAGGATPVIEVQKDAVDHPPHYTSHPSGVECIQIAEHMGFNLGNALKYIWRADLKNGMEDLEKAVWYVRREIERRKKGPRA